MQARNFTRLLVYELLPLGNEFGQWILDMKNRLKLPNNPAERPDTLRHEIIALLSRESLTARELSEQVGIQEQDVLGHLEHIKIALHGSLMTEPAQCMACGFSFRKRVRLKGPGRCPVCKSEHIADPRFAITLALKLDQVEPGVRRAERYGE
jgi:transcriptional regulator